MDALNFIIDEGLIMIPVLFFIGEIVKMTGLFNNRWIPLFILIISILFTPSVIGTYSPDNIVQAVLVAGVTVFGNELIKQSKGDSK